MMYQSTRDHRLHTTSTRAVLEGIAADGGLYMLDDLAALDFDWRSVLEQDAMGMSARILEALLPDFQNMEQLVRQGYAGKFDTDELTPLASVADRPIRAGTVPRSHQRLQGRGFEPAAPAHHRRPGR